MTYGIVNYAFVQGEYEINFAHLITVAEGETLEEAAHNLALTYYDNTEYDKENNYYSIYSDECIMKIKAIQELDEVTYSIMGAVFNSIQLPTY